MDYSHLECFCNNLQSKPDVERFTVAYNAGHINQISKIVKKEVNHQLNNINCDKSYFLNYHLTEIGISDQYENFTIESFNAELVKYDTTFKSILDKQVDNIYLNEIINTVYSNISDANPYKASAKNIQEELNDLVISYFKSDMINFIETKISTFNLESTVSSNKIKWIGKPSHLGFIIGKLAENGYIKPPVKPNGDVNYTQFAKLVKNTFLVDTTESSLSKYLNLECEKGQEPERNFNKNGFNIPNIIEVS